MYRASIDIGSNTILLLIGEFVQGKFKEACTVSRIAGLGRGIDQNKVFSPEAMKDTYDILREFLPKLQQYKIAPKDAVITATEASRVAQNAPEFYRKIADELDLHATLITSEAEAYLTALGVSGELLDSARAEIVIMDIGGASTELIKVKTSPFGVVSSHSFPVGSVRATEWLKQGVFESKMTEHLRDEWTAPYQSDFLLCVAGSMTSVAGMLKGLKDFDALAVHKTSISIQSFKKLIDMIEKLSEFQLLDRFPFLGKRVTTILAGAKVGFVFGEKLRTERFEVSTFGLRYGVLFYLQEHQKLKEQFIFSVY